MFEGTKKCGYYLLFAEKDLGTLPDAFTLDIIWSSRAILLVFSHTENPMTSSMITDATKSIGGNMKCVLKGRMASSL